MTVVYTSVHSPRWADEQKSRIDCFVKFDHYKVEVPFTADARDIEAHGREIFEKCVAGVYGPVADFDPGFRNTSDAATIAYIDPFATSWPELNQFIEEANRENLSGTTRGQVLVWSSMIEVLIFRILKRFLVEHKVTAKLLDSKEMTFSTAIDLSFGLGLISKNEHLRCHKIKEIRNIFAHDWSPDVQHQNVSKPLTALYNEDHSKKYKWRDDTEYLIKIIYAGSCGRLAVNLAERIDSASKQQRHVLE